MGLGLGVCRRVGAEHGGKLEVHHLADRGTRFELILPIDTGLATVEQRRDSRPTSEVPSKRARLLIVDDDAMVLSALRRRLQRRYDTVTVLGGAEALARLAEDPGFDSILCDLIMPEVDGKSFYEAVEQDHPQLADRIVFMSGGAFTPRLRKFAASVSNPVLQKPVTREDIESILSAVRADSE
jgi:CheY-like chemotaxis protein